MNFIQIFQKYSSSSFITVANIKILFILHLLNIKKYFFTEKTILTIEKETQEIVNKKTNSASFVSYICFKLIQMVKYHIRYV